MSATKIIAVEPMGAPRMTKQDRWTDKARGKGRPVVIRYFLYQDELNRQLPGYELPTVLKIEFHLPVSKSWTKKQKAEAYGQYHQNKPDIDNMIKGFMDSFKPEGRDDSHVAVVHAGKYWCQENEPPCIVLEV